MIKEFWKDAGSWGCIRQRTVSTDWSAEAKENNIAVSKKKNLMMNAILDEGDCVASLVDICEIIAKSYLFKFWFMKHNMKCIWFYLRYAEGLFWKRWSRCVSTRYICCSSPRIDTYADIEYAFKNGSKNTLYVYHKIIHWEHIFLFVFIFFAILYEWGEKEISDASSFYIPPISNVYCNMPTDHTMATFLFRSWQRFWFSVHTGFLSALYMSVSPWFPWQ